MSDGLMHVTLKGVFVPGTNEEVVYCVDAEGHILPNEFLSEDQRSILQLDWDYRKNCKQDPLYRDTDIEKKLNVDYVRLFPISGSNIDADVRALFERLKANRINRM